MIIKTNEFVNKLNSRLNQITFSKTNHPRLTGSFKTATYIESINTLLPKIKRYQPAQIS